MFRTAIVNSGSFGKIFTSHIDRLKQLGEVDFLSISSGSEIEIISKLKQYDAVVASTNPNYTDSILAALPNLKIIARHGTGFNNVDMNAANNRKIFVTRTPGSVAATAVAEYTFGLILAAQRNLFAGFDYVRANRWKERSNLIGTELGKKTIGIIGFGNIGKKLAQYAFAFDCKVIFYDRKQVSAPDYCRQRELEGVLENSDIITLHCGLNEQTRNIINQSSLKLFKKGSILINTARGELVDHHAVAEALTHGTLGSYITDVVSDEPINDQHVLLNTQNCVVLPHLGGYSKEFLQQMGETCVATIEAVAMRQVPQSEYLVNSF